MLKKTHERLLGKNLDKTERGGGQKKWVWKIPSISKSTKIKVFRVRKMDSITHSCKVPKNTCTGLLKLLNHEIVVKDEAPDPQPRKPIIQFTNKCLVNSSIHIPKTPFRPFVSISVFKIHSHEIRLAELSSTIPFSQTRYYTECQHIEQSRKCKHLWVTWK